MLKCLFCELDNRIRPGNSLDGARPEIPAARSERGETPMRAYVLVNVRPGKVREIVSAVSAMEGVKHADACWGLPDVFAYIETPDEKSLHRLVMDSLQKLDGVERTETHIVFE